MRSNFLIFLICFFITGCAFNRTNAPHVKILHKITSNYINSSKKEGFKLVAEGEGVLGDINQVGLDFKKVGDVEIPQARRIVMKKFDELLNLINNNEEVREYLHEYPFPPYRLEMTLIFTKANGGLADPPFLAHVSLIQETIYYSIYEKGRLETIYRETYRVAKQKIIEEDYHKRKASLQE